MKVPWTKKQKKKKRCLPTLSHFTNLPFEHHDQPHPQDGECVPDPDQSHLHNWRMNLKETSSLWILTGKTAITTERDSDGDAAEAVAGLRVRV
ncbi:unnamed protein product [Sphenostylis stenocarpa]|uniref:Uncharacterized protein n=1 Tax=Sphenostylis stenocarpa TaxID=92480 RepID=A0AA86TLG7_9FABA|nr:unnamed protein product [Sphenostylis stenocarpa]